jgi:hypothetical protein
MAANTDLSFLGTGLPKVLRKSATVGGAVFTEPWQPRVSNMHEADATDGVTDNIRSYYGEEAIRVHHM